MSEIASPMGLLWLLAAGVLGLASALQSAVGFGFALLAVPVISCLGFPLPQVIAMTLSAMCVQSVLSLAHHREAWKPGPLVKPLLIAFAGLAVGLTLLRGLEAMDPKAVRALVGALLLGLLGLQWLRPTRPRSRVHPAWTGVALTSTGLLGGLAGMPGPPLVLWAYAHNWSQVRIRTTLWTVFLGLNAIQLPVMAVVFGMPALSGIGFGLLTSPLVYLGARLGMALTRVASRRALANLASILLGLIGLSAVLTFLFDRLT